MVPLCCKQKQNCGAAAAWHKEHVAALKAKGLSPELFERYAALVGDVMARLQLPPSRCDAAQRFLRSAW